MLFCKNCSIKENHPLLGFLSPKRYCNRCYLNSHTITRPQTLQVPEQVPEQVPGQVSENYRRTESVPNIINDYEEAKSLPSNEHVTFILVSRATG